MDLSAPAAGAGHCHPDGATATEGPRSRKPFDPEVPRRKLLGMTVLRARVHNVGKPWVMIAGSDTPPGGRKHERRGSRESCRWSYAPPGLLLSPAGTHGSRRGLHSAAPPGLGRRQAWRTGG